MHIIKNLYALLFFIFSALLATISYADTVGLGTPKPATNMANTVNTLGFQQVPKNLTPKEGVVVAKTDNPNVDCVDSLGDGLNNRWYNYNATTYCPNGYMPYEMHSLAPPSGSGIQKINGTVYYRLRCCKAHVDYS